MENILDEIKTVEKVIGDLQEAVQTDPNLEEINLLLQAQKEHLKNHQLSHDPLSHPFVCAFERCGQKFSAKSSLYVHMKRHPKQSGLLQGRLRCLLDACDGAFLYKKDLQASRIPDTKPVLQPRMPF